MTIKIAVCDDELQAFKQIETYLAQIQRETGEEFQVFYFSDGESLLQHMPRDISILLLDIQMSDMTGIETARHLREEGMEFYLFFITSNPQYALEGYSVHAYAFLCKPLQYALFKVYLMEVIEMIKRKRPIMIELKNNAASSYIDARSIIHAEVFGHTSIITLEGGRRMPGKASLNQLEQTLSKHSFFRCHRSYLINLHHVSSIRASEIIMSDQAVIPLSRNRKQQFLIAFHEIMGE